MHKVCIAQKENKAQDGRISFDKVLYLMTFSSSSSSWAIQLRIEDIGKEYIIVFADLWKNNKLKKAEADGFLGIIGYHTERLTESICLL